MARKVKADEGEKRPGWNKQSQKLRLDLKSTHGRKRFWISAFKKAGLVVGIGLIAYAIVLGLQLYQSLRVEMVIRTSERIPEIRISGNSSIPENVIRDIVRDHISENLASVNPFIIKNTLEANGQIKVAKVEKDFPNTLKVQITERLPVLMLAALDAENEVSFWSIDKEGVIYKPFDLQRMKALKLPFVEGLQIDEIEDGVTQVDGIEKVHYLLELLEKDAYEVFNDVKSVSLLHYNRGEPELGALIILRGTQIKKMIFGVENLEYQVIKLIGVLSVAGKIQLSSRNVIDLSYSGDAIVR